MATYDLTCKWCGKHYTTSNELKLIPGFSSKYCSKKCEQDAKAADTTRSSHESHSNPIGANESHYEQQKNAEEIKAEAEVERMERDEKAMQPWKFDSNFYDADDISAISFPDKAADIEKTVLRIIKTANEKIKEVLEQSSSEYQQSISRDQKAMWKPYYNEIKFIDTCIEKANEGIKKLNRFEWDKNINSMIDDCTESLKELKNKWYPKLLAKRGKKKKITMAILIVTLSAFAIFFIYGYFKSK